MFFNSIHFLIFFTVVAVLFFALNIRYRWILLLASSYYFYMSWKAEYVVLLMISTLVDYISALNIYKSESRLIRKAFLILSLFTNLGLLFAFKYFNFFSDSIREFLALFSIEFSPLALSVLLPIGISFYTFQTLGYTIDVYMGKIKPERHLGIFAVYVSFFPQLVAGPIERAGNLLPQFFKKHDFDYRRVTDGLKLMLWGFFKKVVIADRLAIIVDFVYGSPAEYNGFFLIMATVFFAFQIYCDFSGYSDIAIGSAQVMGYSLMDNFNRPYFAKSIAEFWRRWHISLSTWFRDYLYIPLGGNRVPISRWHFNVFTVFLISGLWHGANWTFVIWGALHGLYIMAGAVTSNIREKLAHITGIIKHPKIHQLLKIGVTFSLVAVAWVFFRANSLSDALYIITHMFTDISLDFSDVYLGGIGVTGMVVAFSTILFLGFIHFLQEHMRMRQFLSNKPFVLRWTVYIIMVFSILLFGVFQNKEFIYFQF